MPRTTKAVSLIRKPNAKSYASIRRYNLEYDAEGRVSERVTLIAVCLDPDDNDHADNDEPHVMP
jgi:hypothetical protein